MADDGMAGEATEIGRFGRFRVLHERGSDIATVAGMIHSETLDLAGWRSRRLFYARLRAGPSGAFYSDNLAASECAVAVLDGVMTDGVAAGLAVPGGAKARSRPECWTVHHDARLIETRGRYAEIAKLSNEWWIAESVLKTRWLAIR